MCVLSGALAALVEQAASQVVLRSLVYPPPMCYGAASANVMAGCGGGRGAYMHLVKDWSSQNTVYYVELFRKWDRQRSGTYNVSIQSSVP